MTDTNSVLIESIEKYQFLLNNILDVITEIDLDGTFTYVSPQVKGMLGYKPKEVIGKPFFSYMHPDDMPVIMETFKKAIKGKGLVAIEYRVRHKEGHYIPVFAKGSLVEINDKVKIIGVLREISERKLVEQKLKESEENFREITEQSFMGICIIQDSIIKYVNNTITLILGYSEKEIKEWSMKEFLNVVHPEDRTIAIKRLSRRQKGIIDEKLDRVYRIFTKSGEIKWMDTYSKIIRYQGKDAILATLVDVTEHKKAEQKLSESETKYRALFEQAADSIVLIDTENGEIIDFNDKVYENLGYTREEFKNISIPDFDLMEEDEDYKAHIKKIIREGSDVFETKYKTKTGEIKDILVSAKAITIDDKILLHSILRDITKQKQVEKELREINTLKSELLERTSHELKT
ncbi:MAG: PAS domain-containing protein, partial [Candidatus Lokiarchaeota archaeon]|nr:PAS domain-containing protein [Candidatus Lokiarchaeota archaeon]